MNNQYADNIDQVRLSVMTVEDVPQVHSLERICFPMPWEISAYYRDISNPSAYYTVARIGEQIVGFGGMWVVADEAHIVTLAVKPEYRRHGIGRKLMVALLAEARRRGATIASLEVRVTNLAAQELYKSFGFNTVAFRRHYYPDNDEDAAVMHAAI